MNVPDPAADLLEHVDPIPMRDTEEEAWLLRVLLDLGFHPTCEAVSAPKILPGLTRSI